MEAKTALIIAAITFYVLFIGVLSPFYWGYNLYKKMVATSNKNKKIKYAKQVELMDKYRCTFCGKKPDACWC